MAKVFYEDAYGLGLLYSYMYDGKRKVKTDDLIEFYNRIEKVLENESDILAMYSTVKFDDIRFYYSTCDEEGNYYHVIKPDFDLEEAMRIYIGYLPLKVIAASQVDHVLNAIGLTRENNKIISISCQNEKKRKLVNNG